MDKRPLVCDTSVLLYLGRLGQLDLLPAFFEPILVPDQVVAELDAGRLLKPDTVDPRHLRWASLVTVSLIETSALPARGLGAGERAVLTLAGSQEGSAVGLDDRQARLFAELLGLDVIGTIGILIKARRAGLLPSLREEIKKLQEVGFHLDASLRTKALQAVADVEAYDEE